MNVVAGLFALAAIVALLVDSYRARRETARQFAARVMAGAQRDQYADQLRAMQDTELTAAGFWCRCIECGATFDSAIDGLAHLRSHETGANP